MKSPLLIKLCFVIMATTTFVLLSAITTTIAVSAQTTNNATTTLTPEERFQQLKELYAQPGILRSSPDSILSSHNIS